MDAMGGDGGGIGERDGAPVVHEIADVASELFKPYCDLCEHREERGIGAGGGGERERIRGSTNTPYLLRYIPFNIGRSL